MKYLVKSPIFHGPHGRPYAQGEAVELSDRFAEGLLAAGIVARWPEEEQKAEGRTQGAEGKATADPSSRQQVAGTQDDKLVGADPVPAPEPPAAPEGSSFGGPRSGEQRPVPSSEKSKGKGQKVKG